MRSRPFFLPAVESTVALPVGAAIALAWSNTASAGYERFSHAAEFSVNHVAMAFFFAMATKEVVEAMAPGGALHTWKRGSLPVIAAIGGMAAPALIYVLFASVTNQPDLRRGWAIPCATDVVFSYLVAKAIFRRHAAIPFLLLLAIADDALGLVILAVFYPVGELRLVGGAVLMTAALAAAYGLRHQRVRSFWPYVIGPGALSWSGLRWGGLHPALALVPIVPFFYQRDTLDAFDAWWKHPVQGILFLFGLVNAGVSLSQAGPGTWAVFIGLLAGKPIGILVAVGLAVAGGCACPPNLAGAISLSSGAPAASGSPLRCSLRPPHSHVANCSTRPSWARC